MILEIRGLKVDYGKSRAVDGVDLELEEGEVAALLGRNGAGRSTTLKAIMGLVPPAGGTIVFDGEDITGKAPYAVARRGIAYVPEERRALSNLTVAENMTLAAMGGRPGPWTQEAICELFPLLRERSAQLARTLSGGEQQMLVIGRALAANPRLILIDEPLEGLAPALARDVERSIQELKRRGVTMLLVEQNSEMTLRVADRGYIIEFGRVVHSGTAEELRADPDTVHQYLAL